MAMQKKRKTIVFAVVILALVVIFSLFVYLKPWGENAKKLDSIDVAYSPFESIALFWVAQEQGFFSQNGLNVTSHKYDTGAGALDGMVNGEADIAVGTNEFPLTRRALNNVDARTFASISKSEFIYLIGRKDRGIDVVSDLKGKTVGTTFGTIAHFYLGRFLALNGIDIQDVVLVDLKTPVEWVDAVVNGTIDAVATAQPYANLAKESLGVNAVAWSAQSNQPLFTQVIATSKWISEHPELVIRFLESLAQAEEYAINNPAQAKAIVKQQMNFTDDYTETVWMQNQFRLSLDQAQIIAMGDEARWLINNNLTNATSVPNFLDYIYTDGLKAVKPQSVTIIK